MPSSWTLAAIDDFNGDGELDVAAADPISASVAFLFRAGDREFNRIDVALPIAPSRLASGDFDGDGVFDLAAVIERERDEIHVIFGEKSGPPTDAAFMARFPNIAHIQSTFFLSPAPWNPDRINDLIVEVSETEGAFPQHAAILVGTGRRRLHSPIPLFSEQFRFGAPHDVGIGRLDSSAGADLIALTLQGQIWTLKNRERARFATGDVEVWSSTVSAAGICNFPVRARPAGCGQIEVGPIRGDDADLDDAILADRTSRCPQLPGPIGLGLITTVDDQIECTPINAEALVGARTKLEKIKLGFVNNDSAIDLVMALDGEDSAAPAVVVAFGDGTGAFPVKAEIALEATPIDMVEVGRSQLAILTHTGLFVVTFEGETAVLVDHVAMLPADSSARVTAAPVNVDGLEDLIFSAGGRLYVYEASEGFAGDEDRP
jgi:VCBS repeat protein